MISRLRNRIRRFSLLLARPFAALGIHPNIVSLMGIPFALIYAFFILQNNLALALVFAALAVSMDLIDGSVATLLNKRSNFGNYFEAMIDKTIDFILLAVFVLRFPIATILATSLSFLASYAKPRVALVIITDNRDWPSIGEHGDKLIILMAGLLVSIFAPAIAGIATIEATLYLVAIICGIGTIQRMFYAKKLIAEAEKNGTLLPYLRQKKER